MAKVELSTDATRINELRRWINAAEQGGAAADDMVLRLTVRDASMLKRHPSVGVHEIAFQEGRMCFLGVNVQEGGVATSVLERTGA